MVPNKGAFRGSPKGEGRGGGDGSLLSRKKIVLTTHITRLYTRKHFMAPLIIKKPALISQYELQNLQTKVF